MAAGMSDARKNDAIPSAQISGKESEPPAVTALRRSILYVMNGMAMVPPHNSRTRGWKTVARPMERTITLMTVPSRTPFSAARVSMGRCGGVGVLIDIACTLVESKITKKEVYPQFLYVLSCYSYTVQVCRTDACVSAYML